MVRENHKMVREMSGKSQGILWGLMAGHPVDTFISQATVACVCVCGGGGGGLVLESKLRPSDMTCPAPAETFSSYLLYAKALLEEVKGKVWFHGGFVFYWGGESM